MAVPIDPERHLRPVSVEEATAQAATLAELACDRIMGCCSADDAEAAYAACVAGYTHCFDNPVEELAGSLSIDEDQLQVCEAKLDALSCEQAPPNYDCNSKGYYAGPLAAGEACDISSQCRGPGFSRCQGDRCIEEYRGKLGDVCAYTCRQGPGETRLCFGSGVLPPDRFASCWQEDGLYCSANAGCQPLLARGAACDRALGCERELSCSADVCTDPKAIGATCSFSDDCAPDAYCDVQCQPVKAAGDACEDHSECTTGYCSNRVCGDAASICRQIAENGLVTCL